MISGSSLSPSSGLLAHPEIKIDVARTKILLADFICCDLDIRQSTSVAFVSHGAVEMVLNYTN